MPRLVAAAFLSALVGLIAGAGIVMKMNSEIPAYPDFAVVDLARVLDRQRAEISKSAGKPEEVNGMIEERMNRLALILSDLGRDQVVLNKPAVLIGRLPDLTYEVEARLSAME